MQAYDFSDFIARMAKLDYLDILQQANAEIRRVEASSYGVKGAPQRRAMGSADYAEQIKAFLWFMTNWTRPATAANDEFASYRQIIEALVGKGQVKREILKQF